MASLLTSLAGPVIGGLLGGSGSKSSQTQTNTIDPRLAEAIYGSNGSVPAAQQWFSQNKTGMNPQMQQGLTNQAAQYAASKPGFDQMQNLGLGLMGGGVAGNPFSQGYSGGTNFNPQGRGNMAGQNQPSSALGATQAYTPATFLGTADVKMPEAAPVAAEKPKDILSRYWEQLDNYNQFSNNVYAGDRG